MKAYFSKPLTNTRIMATTFLICVSAAAHAQERSKVPLLGATLRASMDKAVLVRMPAGMRTVVIGNPAVAQISFDRSGLAVVTGRSFGETNLIVLDDSGDIIAETDLVVSDDRKSLVSVQSGMSGKVTVSCDPRCQPVAVVGDDDKAFSGISGQISTLTSAAQQAAQISAGSAPAIAVPSAPVVPAAAPPGEPVASPGASVEAQGSRPRAPSSMGAEVIPAKPAPKFEGVSAEAQ